MKTCGSLLVALAAALSVSDSAWAANEAYALFEISEFGFYVDLGGGVAGAPITNGVHISVLGVSNSSSASVNLASVAGGPVSTSNFAASSAGLDTAQAFEGSGGAPPSNTFANTLGPVPLAVADTWGSGAAVAGLADPFLAAVKKVSEVDLSVVPTSTDFGTAGSVASTNASFTIVPLAPLDIVGIFKANTDLLADLRPTPPGAIASADTSFTISIREATAGLVFGWSPDGFVGGITGGVEYSDPYSLNGSISAFPGTLATQTHTGGVFSAGVTLLPGKSYSFTIDCTTDVVAATVGVPEAATAALAGWLIVPLSRARRRR